MKIKGKQLADATITQQQLGITTESITDPTHVTTKEYVENAINSGLTNLSYSEDDINLIALQTQSGVTSLSTTTSITNIPQGGVRVYVNGVEVNAGTHSRCYCAFSPDGVTFRQFGYEEQGDQLYWNTNIGVFNAPFQLTTDDEIDFVYLTINAI